MEVKHKAELEEMKVMYEARLKAETVELKQDIGIKVADTAKDIDKTVKSEDSIESSKTEETEKEEDQEKVTSTTGSSSDKSDKDDDDSDGKGGGKGAARTPSRSTTSDVADKHDGGSKQPSETSKSVDETDGGKETSESEETESAGEEDIEGQIQKTTVQKVKAVKKTSAKKPVHELQHEEEKLSKEKTETTEGAEPGGAKDDSGAQLSKDETDLDEIDSAIEKPLTEQVEKKKAATLRVSQERDTVVEDSEIVIQLREELDSKVITL